MISGVLLAEGFLTVGIMPHGRVTLFHSVQFLAAFGVMLAGVRRNWNVVVAVLLALAVLLVFPLLFGSLTA